MAEDEAAVTEIDRAERGMYRAILVLSRVDSDLLSGTPTGMDTAREETVADERVEADVVKLGVFKESWETGSFLSAERAGGGGSCTGTRFGGVSSTGEFPRLLPCGVGEMWSPIEMADTVGRDGSCAQLVELYDGSKDW